MGFSCYGEADDFLPGVCSYCRVAKAAVMLASLPRWCLFRTCDADLLCRSLSQVVLQMAEGLPQHYAWCLRCADGNRFLSANECTIHPTYKEKILKPRIFCTMITGKRLGHLALAVSAPQLAREYSRLNTAVAAGRRIGSAGNRCIEACCTEGDNEKGCFSLVRSPLWSRKSSLRQKLLRKLWRKPSLSF